MSAQIKATRARRVAQARIETLNSQLAEARARSEAGRRTAESARADYKQARKTFKRARKAAKALRKEAKTLKRELAKATLAASLVKVARSKKAAAPAKKKILAVRNGGRKTAVAALVDLLSVAVPPAGATVASEPGSTSNGHFGTSEGTVVPATTEDIHPRPE